VLAWLPARLPADALRRLQLAAQGHEGPAFLLRDVQEAPRQRRAAAPAAGQRRARPAAVHLLKRRGPPLASR
jgi:protein ImuA